MSFCNHIFDEHTEKFSGPTLRRIREFAQSTPLEGPLAIEIGSNRGRFLRSVASDNPEIHHVGIEIRKKYAIQAQKRCERAGLTNTHVLCADANLVIPIIASQGQIRTFYLVCPDPWWKQRHEKRRIIQTSFLDMMAEKMEDNGSLYIRTDVGMLAEWMRNHLDEHPDFSPKPPQDYPSTPFLLSTRERHVVSYGMPIYPLYYIRKPRS